MSEPLRSPSVLSITSMASDTSSISGLSASTTEITPEVGDDGVASEAASPPNERASPITSARFYFRDGSLTLVTVEGTMYNVHGSLFEMHSPYWAAKLRKGEWKHNVGLDDVKGRELDAFLSILYPAHFSNSKGPSVASTENWCSVLRLSTLWSFEDLRSLAIEHLSILALPLEQLVLSRKYCIPEWRVPAYVSLCLRDSLLSKAEAARLTTDDIIDIASGREAVLNGQIPRTEDSLWRYLSGEEPVLLDDPCRVQPPPTPETEQTSTLGSAVLDISASKDTAFNFTSEETSRLSELCRTGEFGEALLPIDEASAAAFWDLARTSSDILNSEASMRKFTRAVKRRCGLESSFIAVARIIMRSVLASCEEVGDTQGQVVTTEGFRTILNQDIRALLWTWSRISRAETQWVPGISRSMNGYIVPYAKALSAAINNCTQEVLGSYEELHNAFETYHQRSSNVKDLIHALIEEGIMQNNVLRL